MKDDRKVVRAIDRCGKHYDEYCYTCERVEGEAAARIEELEADKETALTALRAVEFELTDLGHSNGRTMRALNRAREAIRSLGDGE